jgi:uncharacterized protein YgbK (DUF1537 family)
MKLGVVADDITGSGDIGSMLAGQGWAVRVFSAAELDRPDRLAAARTDAAILDTDSRFDPPAVAADKVRRATEVLVAWGADRFYKKTCSVFRGNVGAELDAMLAAIGEERAVVVAAFPRNGRVTRGGHHYVHGVPLDRSEFARDPIHPRTESNLVVDLARQTARPVHLVPAGGPFDLAASGYHLCDAESQADLAAIAGAASAVRALGGASALAEELGRVWPAPAPFDPMAGVELGPSGASLVVAGSVMPQTRAQIAALEAAGVEITALASHEILGDLEGAIARAAARAGAALAAGRPAVLRSENNPDAVARARALGASRGLAPVAVSRAVSDALAEAAARALELSGATRLIALGGDTSAALCARLAIDEMLVLDEIEPGLPVSLVPGSPARLLVLKSGSFGGPDFVLKALARLG